MERLLWLLVALVAVAGVVLIGAIVRSGPASDPNLPPADGVSDAPHVEAAGPVGGAAGDRAPPDHDDGGPDDDDPPGSDHLPGSGPGAPSQPGEGASDVARGFGFAFTRTSVGRDAWFAAMSSWLTPEQAAQYRDVPVEAIPSGELTAVEVVDPGSKPHTRGTLTYDTGLVLAIGLSRSESAGGWLVARVTLADTDPAE